MSCCSVSGRPTTVPFYTGRRQPVPGCFNPAEVPMFCRHNRLEANCPICSREKAAARPAPGSSRPGTTARRTGGTSSVPAARRHGAGSRAGRLVTRKLARATDDGYHHDLVPGVKATADAERLARALAIATARLEFPGPYPAVAELDDPEEATWLAFLLALAGADRPELQDAVLEAGPAFGGSDGTSGLGPDAERTIVAYRAWAARSGSQVAAVAGEPAWTPARRFARTFDRLALPGFTRAARFEFLLALGAAGLQELEADALHVAVAHDDATTLAAQRALNSGDAVLLGRRASALAEGAGVPIGALDRGLALWDRPAPLEPPAGARLDGIRAALRLG